MEMKEVKTEVLESNDDKFGLDLHIVKDEELVAKLCTEEIYIKDELEDVPIDECYDVELTGNNYCEDEHSEFPEVKMEESLVSKLPCTYYSTAAIAIGESDNSNSQYFKQSSDQKTSLDVKYFKDFSNKVTLANQKIEDSSGTRSYKCDDKLKLAKHIRTHAGKKLYACNICSYTCGAKSNLTRHVRRHTVERSYACGMCSYKCNDNSKLATHIRIHTGEKPYSCDLCNYKCVDKSSLTRHTRTHTGEKPYACDICSFKCVEKSKLTIHSRIHTGEKPYACNECNYKCNEKSSLNKHIRRHAGEKPYACDICSYKCGDKSDLIKHIRRHTSVKSLAC